MAKLSPVLAFAVLTLLPAAALGQTMTVRILEFQNADREATAVDLVTIPLSAADCSSASADLRLEMVDSTKNQIDIWRGSNCNDTTQRAGMASNECVNFALMGQDQIINTRSQMDFEGVAFAELLEGCSLADGQYGIWFLATNMASSNEEVTNYASLDIVLDTTAPLAPVNVVGGRGGTQINVTWEAGNGVEASDHKEYRVYGDPSSAVDGDSCEGSTTVFVPGEPTPSGVFELSRGTGRSATINPDMFNIAENRSGYVAVVEVDQAGNESVVSEVACIARVPTTGFCDAYGENCTSCSASGAPGLPLGAPYGALGVFALALLGLRRRKSRR